MKIRKWHTVITAIVLAAVWGVILLPSELKEFTIHKKIHTVCDTVYVKPKKKDRILEDFCGQTPIFSFIKRYGDIFTGNLKETSDLRGFSFYLCFLKKDAAGVTEIPVDYGNYLLYGKSTESIHCPKYE